MQYYVDCIPDTRICEKGSEDFSPLPFLIINFTQSTVMRRLYTLTQHFRHVYKSAADLPLSFKYGTGVDT